MKKSLLALAVLGVFAGAASAQSSVTIYGFVNLGVGKPLGTDDKAVLDGAGSRIGFRGVEDLGGGYAALFGMEHRFDPDTGEQNVKASTSLPSGRFWQGYTTVGLRGPFGTVNLGRQYTPTFSLIQNQIDPFGGDNVGQLRQYGLQIGPAKIRVADSIRYDFSASGFNFAASIAESGPTNAGGNPEDKPYAFALNYAAGPLFIGAGYENPADADDNLWTIGARYNFGFATFSGGFSKGTTDADQTIKGFLVGGTVPIGAGDLKFGYAQNRLSTSAADLNRKKASVGYHYNLSKRTKVFGEFARIGGNGLSAAERDERSGYTLGMQHNF